MIHQTLSQSFEQQVRKRVIEAMWQSMDRPENKGRAIDAVVADAVTAGVTIGIEGIWTMLMQNGPVVIEREVIVQAPVWSGKEES